MTNCASCGATLATDAPPERCPVCGGPYRSRSAAAPAATRFAPPVPSTRGAPPVDSLAEAADSARQARIADLMLDSNHDGVPDVIEQMAAGAAPAAAIDTAELERRLARVPPAPRVPSPRARKLIYAYQGKQWALLLIGVIFLLVGLPLTLVFCKDLPYEAALDLAATRDSAEVLGSEVVANVSVNGRHPTRIRFRYQVAGRTHEASSSTLDGSSPATGATVDIERLDSAPEVARIVGTSYSLFPLWLVFVAIFPAVGAALTVAAVRSNRREILAFSRGTPALAHVTFEGEDTSTTVNGRHPYEIRWRFDVGAVRGEGSLSHLDRSTLAGLVQAGRIVVLYDPARPEINTAWVE